MLISWYLWNTWSWISNIDGLWKYYISNNELESTRRYFFAFCMQRRQFVLLFESAPSSRSSHGGARLETRPCLTSALGRFLFTASAHFYDKWALPLGSVPANTLARKHSCSHVSAATGHQRRSFVIPGGAHRTQGHLWALRDRRWFVRCHSLNCNNELHPNAN